MEREITKEGTPDLMDIRTVVGMFQQLREDLKNMGAVRTGDINQSEMKMLREELNEHKLKTDVLMGVVNRIRGMLNEHERKFEFNEKQAMKTAVMLSGFLTKENKAGCIIQQ